MITFTLAPARLPDDERIYAIGDVHGCADRLAALHDAVAADLAARPVAAALLIHLGDYIDRGPDSAGVLARLLRGPPAPAPPPSAPGMLCLMGNHEQMMLAALDSRGEGTMARLWLANGGAASLASWQVPPDADPATWRDAIPEAHLAFIRALKLQHRAGGYLFVHAGLRPGVPQAHQSQQDLLWIREPFLTSEADFGAVVVHGHTITPEPVVRPNRVGIDTGAVVGGKLTCLVLEADRLGFLTA